MFTPGLFAGLRRRLQIIIAVEALLVVILVAGCNTKDAPSDQQVRQQTAQATSDVKQGAKQAGQDVKDGAAVAKRTLDDVAAGVKDGLKSDSSTDSKAAVDINSATENQLTTLPGVGPSLADKIIQNRPYDHAHDLVKKGVMDQQTFDKASSRIVVR